MATTPMEQQRRAASRILFCPSEERTVRELQELPSEDREQVWADMTGDPETTYYRIHAENPEFVAQCLAELSKTLEHYSHPNRSSFDRACQQNSDYVSSQRLKFMRAENFDPSAAANRMIAYFQRKEELFGTEILSREIRQTDLSADDLESLKAGGMQLLHGDDHATRGVLFTRNRNYCYKERENQLRALFYMTQCISENEHYQKVGFVSISYQVGGYPAGGYDFELTRKISTLVRCIPIRFSAIYLCYSLSPWKHVADLVSHLVGPFLRVRLRSVQGSHQECLYNLIALGVPNDIIPLSNQGEELLENHWKWIESRRKLEEAM